MAAVLALALALPAAAPLADSRRYHDHRRHNNALMGGVFGGAVLGTMLWSMTRPYDPPRYVYVEPPPAYYLPPVPPYPPVPVYPPPPVEFQPPPPAYAPAPAPLTMTQRLEELQQACKRNLMTKAECDAKRKSIIEGM